MIAFAVRKIGQFRAEWNISGAAESLSTAPLLKDYYVPAGRHGSINVGWQPNGAAVRLDPAAAIREGYDGIRIIGAGVDATTLHCTSWDGITVAVKRGPWIIKFENLTIEAGSRCAAMVGEENLPAPGSLPGTQRAEPKFQWHMLNVKGVVLPPDNGRTKWCWFSYGADRYWVNVVTDACHASEHGSYAHGYAKLGSLLVGCHFIAAGAQCDKTRSDATETAWAGPAVANIYRDCTFENWHQTWTDRGGAAVVGEGGACHWLFERCSFIGGMTLTGPPRIAANARALCVGISSEGVSYDMATGRVGVGSGNGWVIMRQCMAWGHSDVPWNNNIVRVARNGGTQAAARGVIIEDCGIWGQMLVVTVGEVPAGKVKIQRCNTPALRAWAESRGVDATHEAKFPTATQLVPLSQGITR